MPRWRRARSKWHERALRILVAALTAFLSWCSRLPLRVRTTRRSRSRCCPTSRSRRLRSRASATARRPRPRTRRATASPASSPASPTTLPPAGGPVRAGVEHHDLRAVRVRRPALAHLRPRLWPGRDAEPGRRHRHRAQQLARCKHPIALTALTGSVTEVAFEPTFLDTFDPVVERVSTALHEQPVRVLDPGRPRPAGSVDHLHGPASALRHHRRRHRLGALRGHPGDRPVPLAARRRATPPTTRSPPRSGRPSDASTATRHGTDPGGRRRLAGARVDPLPRPGSPAPWAARTARRPRSTGPTCSRPRR